MSKQFINQYYNQVHTLKRTGHSNEMTIKQPFDTLMQQMAFAKNYVYALEVTIKNEKGKNIRPDGILMNELRIHKGYVESKDTGDSIETEIEKKLHKDGYPKTNIIFQDSIEAILIQNGEEAMRIQMKDANRLKAILKAFLDYKPAYIQKFDEALHKFKEDIPTIVETLRALITKQNQTNKTYTKARDAFWKMCKQEINPAITQEDIREMVIQHILTEDLFKSVFNEADFHSENNIARELEKLVNTFMNRIIRQNQLGELAHYYKTLNAQASKVADHHEKQQFLKVVYENFYKVYNPKGADRLGVVYTPNEIVGFMIRSTDYLLAKHFGRALHDKNVHILDPATGTGTFITDIIEYIPAQYLEYKYKNEIHANEVAILPYYVANLNIEFTYKQKMREYAEFPNSCFVDTLDNTASLKWDRMSKDQGVQTKLYGGVSSENVARIKKQNQQKISVVIGNPPYNANQTNFNDFNKNREYDKIDERIKNTFVKYSQMQNRANLYDMYTRFYRWAMDRVDKNGIVSFITNRSFIDSRAFDGFRKSVREDFDHIYIIDLGGDIRASMGSGKKIGNVFGIITGVAIMFLIKKEKKEDTCRIEYTSVDDLLTKTEKLDWLRDSKMENIPFEKITPDKKNNWINLADNNWDELMPLVGETSLFELHSLGVNTNRDEWVYDFDKKSLELKMKFFVSEYNKNVEESDRMRPLIKWSSSLESYFKRKLKGKYSNMFIQVSLFRPFTKKHHYREKIFNHRLTKKHYVTFGKELSFSNLLICLNTNGKDFYLLSSNLLVDLHTTGDCQYISIYHYNSNGTRQDNITDWGLTQFQTHYSDKKITKEDIFHYTYSVLHHPAYRKKYEINLKREFPRLPFYEDFHQWTKWGKTLMDLHIGYEDVKPYKLKQTDIEVKGDQDRKIKVKLRADKKAGIIELDEQTSLSSLPTEAWDYKLGNRSAIEWVLDQYKEKKPRDKTIAEKFNTYRFANYKTQVIELLKKITTVSVETMQVIKKMENIEN